METKQYSVKVFEVTLTDEESFVAFFDAKHSIFKNHLILINGKVSPKIEAYLNEKQLKFLVNVELPKRKTSTIDYGTPSKPQETQQTFTPPKAKEKAGLKVRDSLVRSGQEINMKTDLLLLNRVNSGGKINIDGNLIITQIVDGAIRCNGDFMMLKASKKANIIFHDVEVDNSYLKERLNKVELKNNEIVITPVLKETNWA